MKTTRETVRFSRKWFNPLFFHINHYAADPKIRRILLYGGKRSAKTFSALQWIAKQSYMYQSSAICYRKESERIPTTLKPAISKAIETIRFNSVFKKYDREFRCVNGEVIVMTGLDNEDKIKGIEGYRYLLFDEINQFTLNEWLEANQSLSAMPDQKIFATWNPISERHWLKVKVIDKMEWEDLPNVLPNQPYSELDQTSRVQLSGDGRTLLIKTTYLDNKWIVGGDGFGFVDQAIIDEYRDMHKLSMSKYRVNVLGEWGVPEVDRPFLHNFNEEIHVSRCDYDERHPIWLCFDFNKDPFVCTVRQFYPVNGVFWDKTIKQFRIDNGDVATMCKIIKQSYSRKAISSCYVTGDSTGGSRHVGMKGNLTIWKQIVRELNVAPPRVRVPKTNMGVKESGDMANYYLNQHGAIAIDPSCTHLIQDMIYVEADEEGKIKKSNRANKYQRADDLDTWLYGTHAACKFYPQLSKYLSYQ